MHKIQPDENTAAICGLFCGTCPFYPRQCGGCLSDRLTAHCVNCPNGFRACAREHGIMRCYECAEFPCERLRNFSTKHWENGICHHAEVITNLMEMKKSGIESWVTQQTKENTCPQCGSLVFWMEKQSHRCKR